MGQVLRAACQQVRQQMYAITHMCTAEEAQQEVGAQMTRSRLSRQDVEQFCCGLGLDLSGRPKSFFHCPLNVIKYNTWSAENVTGMFTYKLWLSNNEVDDMLAVTARVRAQLGAERFIRVSNSVRGIPILRWRL